MRRKLGTTKGAVNDLLGRRTGRAEYQGFLDETGERYLGLASQRVLSGDNAHHLLGQHRRTTKAGVGGKVGQDSDINLSAQKGSKDAAVRPSLHGHQGRGVILHQLTDDGDARHRIAEAHTQQMRACAGSTVQDAVRVTLCFLDALADVAQLAAKRGRPQAAVCPVKEVDTVNCFQLGDLLGHGGMRQAKEVCGGGKAACLGHGKEGSQPGQCQGASRIG